MQPMIPNDSQNISSTPGIPSTSEASPQIDSPTSTSQPSDQAFFYLPDDDLEEDEDQLDQSSPFVMPFQDSASMPTVVQPNARSMYGTGGMPISTPPKSSLSGGPFRALKWFVIIGLVLITLIIGTVLVFAQTALPPTNQRHRIGIQTPTVSTPTSQQTHTASKPKGKVTISPTPIPQNQGQQGTQGASVPVTSIVPTQQTLNQMGWTNAGLSISDAIEVQRTAQTFTDREMSFDYRNIGTLDHHGGTFIGAEFLLTPGALSRFAQNDVRAINNVLYNNVHDNQIIQQALISQSQLTQFQIIPVQGQQQKFAWVTVSFQLWKSAIDKNTGQHTQSIELDPNTQQPRVHTMTVLLIRVSPQRQGPGAPMGGTGWLVNSYALDVATLPTIATDPSV